MNRRDGATSLGVVAVVMSIAILTCFAPARLDAQRPPPRSSRDTTASRDTIKVKRDSLGRIIPDSLVRDSLGRTPNQSRELVTWAPDDSVTRELMQRKGYQVTRYQGDTVIFRAVDKTIDMIGKKSAVQRDQTILVGDTIVYNDSLKHATARGDTLVLRDPTSGNEDIVVHGRLEYDIEKQIGLTTDISTAVESGQKWIVHGERAAFQNDSTGEGRSAFYAKNGWITSCTETVPHYHFQAKQMKVVSKNIMVARPAILYIRDIPVMWLPFIFQDMRSGRRSGLIPPKFGFSDIVRNAPTYRRTVDNFGYYFALNDYVDAQATMDWRSGAGATQADPGWVRLNGVMRYAWLDRFLTGQLAVGRMTRSDGSTNLQLSLSHQQEFSSTSRLTANLNYVTNTTVQRQSTFNPYSALATINSQLNYSQQLGQAQIAIGGSQKQYPGRDQLDRDFPSINITSQPLKLGEWLTWTPTFAFANSQSLNNDQPGQFSQRYFVNTSGNLDSTAVKRNLRNSSASLETPLKIFGFDWRNSLRFRDNLSDFPEQRIIRDPNDSSSRSVQVFSSNYQSELDWDTGINLPSALQGTWNVTPSVSFSNVTSGGLFIRNNLTGGQWVHQSKRPNFSLSSSPTFYALFPGLGPISRFRHSIQPIISFDYAPRGNLSDDYLRAINSTRAGFLGADPRSAMSLTLSTNIEAKLRTPADTTPDAQPKKVKLASFNFTPLQYDFLRAKKTGKGFTTDRFGITARSDLLPGLDFGMDYSLYQGSVLSDTAIFKPFRESMRGSLNLTRESGIVVALARLFGVDLKAKHDSARVGESDQGPPIGGMPGGYANQQVATQSLSGGAAGPIGGAFGSIPTGRGFQTNLTFSATRQRPVVGGNQIVRDPRQECAYLQSNPFLFDQCVQTKVSSSNDQLGLTTSGGPVFQSPPQTNMQGSTSFNITPKWAAQWSTTYDFVEHRFASQVVSLQRELHDWNAIFAFTQAPNGNFAFNFYIALKAEPDLKFNYDRRSFRRGSSSLPQQ